MNMFNAAAFKNSIKTIFQEFCVFQVLETKLARKGLLQ